MMGPGAVSGTAVLPVQRTEPDQLPLSSWINGSSPNSQRGSRGSRSNTKPVENNLGKPEEVPPVLEEREQNLSSHFNAPFRVSPAGSLLKRREEHRAAQLL